MPLNRPPALPLVSLLCDAADPHRTIAFGTIAFGTIAFGTVGFGSAGFGPGRDGPDSPCSHARLLADVSALATTLAADRGRRWLLETEDAYRIAVSLLAAAIVGARVALPPNLQPGTLAELGAQCDRVFVDATSPSATIENAAARANAADILDPLAPGRDAPDKVAPDIDAQDRGVVAAGAPIDRHAPLVDLFTSGTSGPGKLVTKALCHLEDEVVELERMFGDGFELGAAMSAPTSAAMPAVVLATVPAHHLYGLLFRVLWPLAFARPFHRASFLLPDDLLARVAETPNAIVVSSPAHLRHLAASPRLAEHAPAIRAIFSSGGPLETATALELEAVTGRAPLEIFGSTETGGVASRRATAADPSPRWSVFAPVTIDVTGDDGCLVVTSPFVTPPVVTSPVAAAPSGETTGASSGSAQSWTMGDRIERDGDGFRLLGRGDRIAKVGEKTLSLPEIEESLAAHDDVEAAVAGTYASRGGQRLGAIVVLSAAGKRHLAEEGRRALQARLAAHLAQRWDRVALPRRWRFRDALPVDARGKIARESFEAELGRAAEEPVEPLLVSRRRDGNDEVFELVVPRDLAYLAGHYEAFPLVPGVVQIHWVMTAIGRILGRTVRAQRMEAVKFKNVLRPAQVFTMRLGFEPDSITPDAAAASQSASAGSKVSFTLAHQARVFSSGRITLAA